MDCSLRRVLVALALVLALGGPVHAGQAELRFVPVRIEDAASDLPASVRESALEQVAAQEAQPTQIVALIHGFDTSYEQSEAQYNVIAGEIRREFQARGERVAIVGIQWPSDAGAMRKWLPRSLAHYTLKAIGFKKAVKDPYQQRVLMAGNLGARPVRELLLDLEERFPAAHLQVFAHSLGCVVALHAVDPVSDPDEMAESLSFDPGKKLNVDILSLAAADVDQDQPLPVFGNGTASIRLFWITLPDRGARRDRVLMLRKITQGKAAVGDRGPDLAESDLDRLISGRRLVFDTHNIPENHGLTDYYDDTRVGRLAESAAVLDGRSNGATPFLEELTSILKAPITAPHLRKNLASDDASVRLYSLWRLETGYCGSTRHFGENGSLGLAALALCKPDDLAKEREKSACAAFKSGYSGDPPPRAAH